MLQPWLWLQPASIAATNHALYSLMWKYRGKSLGICPHLFSPCERTRRDTITGLSRLNLGRHALPRQQNARFSSSNAAACVTSWLNSNKWGERWQTNESLNVFINSEWLAEAAPMSRTLQSVGYKSLMFGFFFVMPMIILLKWRKMGRVWGCNAVSNCVSSCLFCADQD